jgi:hypothetical protein
MSNTFVSVNDVVLVETIGRAEERLVFIAPGLRPSVANALANAMAVVPNSAIRLVLDVDAEVSRCKESLTHQLKPLIRRNN